MSRKLVEHKTWDVNDYAFLIYAKYKGANHSQIGEVLGVSRQAVAQQNSQMNRPEVLSKKMQAKINKAGILEMKVRGGFYPDHRQAWDDKLSRVTGIAYSYPEKELADEVEEPETYEEVGEECETEEIKNYPPLVQFSISTEAVIALIKAWKK